MGSEHSPNGKTWPDLVHHYFKYLLIIIFIFIIGMIIVYITKGKITLGDISFEKSQTQKHDTVILKRYDTVYINTPIKKSDIPTVKEPINYKKSSVSNTNTGLNQGNIGGENNTINNKTHQVGGDNNGINGDVNVTPEKSFLEADQIRLLSFMQNLEKGNTEKIKCFSIGVYNSSNGGKIANQIRKFLISKGYQNTTTGTLFGSPCEGVNVIIKDKCFQIDVGII